MDETLREAALAYHRLPSPGKLAVVPTTRLATQVDLALAYSPGVAAPCELIAADPEAARDYTARGNLVAVITNGTAVLGLGDIGPLASKPVMEGKAALFKAFAGVDVFDIEVDARDPERFVEVVAALEPTFGGINLEDIKAPECFRIEQALRARMRIPVFHDDQHGTAIVCAAAVRNALELQGKALKDVRLVTAGAGAAATACVDLLVAMGLPSENVTLTDVDGVIHAGRKGLSPRLAGYARETRARTLADALPGADIFLGLSAPGVLRPEWLAGMAARPLILALANPEPEILPELAEAARPDAIVATGRSDYPNQVNNVLCFPFVFRGALDVGATEINEAMKAAAAEAIAELARAEPSEVAASAYGGSAALFGPRRILPRPFDPRLILAVAPAVARAAMESGVARRPLADLAAYRRALEKFAYRSSELMRPLFARARKAGARVAYAQGEDDRVLQAVQTVVDEGLAHPVLVGRREAIEGRARALGLRIRPGEHVTVVDPREPRVIADLVAPYQALLGGGGLPAAAAERRLATCPTILAAMLLQAGRVDAALVGGGDWRREFAHARAMAPRRPEASCVFALSTLVLPKGPLFVCDTHVNPRPTAAQITEMTLLAAQEVRRYGFAPRAVLLAHPGFGVSAPPSARKMRQALAMVRAAAPELEARAEMLADTARCAAPRGAADLLVLPGLDAANVALGLLGGEAVLVGPVLVGLSKPLQFVTPATSARGVVNMTAIAAVQAQDPA